MSRPLFSFRPNPENPEHWKAWEILKNIPEGQKNAFLVQAILQADQASRLEEMLRRAVREELYGFELKELLQRVVREELGEVRMEKLPMSEEPEVPELEIPVQMLDFLSRLE